MDLSQEDQEMVREIIRGGRQGRHPAAGRHAPKGEPGDVGLGA